MEGDDGGVTRPALATSDEKEERKQRSVEFKAQHALVVAFFFLLL
jgi:hypothetical protein